MNFNVAVVHDQILCHEIFKSSSINYFKFTVPFESIYHRVNSFLKLIPVLLVCLDFCLRAREILIELFEVIVVVYLLKLILLRDLAQLSSNFFAKFAGLFWKLLLHLKEIPIRSDTREHIIEKGIELVSEAIPYTKNVISQSYLVFRQILPDFALNDRLTIFDILERFFNLFLERSFEIQFVHGIEGHHRMKQVVGVKALCANFLLAFKAE